VAARLNFGGMPEELAGLQKSRFVVLPVPYEHTTTYRRGTAGGPSSIIAASSQVELFDEELGTETFRAGICTLPEFRFKGPPEKFVAKLEKHVEGIPLDGKTLVTLGGEHTVTVPVVRAVAKRFGRMSVLVLDAHTDLRPEYEGSIYNHACAMSRVAEVCPVVQACIRNTSVEEIPFVNRGRVRTFFAHETRGAGAYRRLAKNVCGLLADNVYVSVDIDAFNPAEVPGTGTPEPGGPGWFEILDLLRPVFLAKRVVAFDVVEVSPTRDSVVSEFTAAKLVYRLMGYVTKGRGGGAFR
jgi:agmatinase